MGEPLKSMLQDCYLWSPHGGVWQSLARVGGLDASRRLLLGLRPTGTRVPWAGELACTGNAGVHDWFEVVCREEALY